MINNKHTNDRPAPQPVGNPLWVSELGDNPSWAAQNGTYSAVYTGQRYTITDAIWITGFRFWVPVTDQNRTYELWNINNPTTNPDFTQLLAPTKFSTVGWQSYPVGSILVTAGVVIDLILVTIAETGAPSTFNGNWSYLRSNSAPLSGEATHTTNGVTLTFNHTDNDSGDRQAALEAVTVGGTITGDGITWTIVDKVNGIDDVVFSVTPTSRDTEGVHNFVFTYEGPINLNWVNISDYYSSAHELFGAVEGYFSNSGYDPSDTLDENAYGVDLEMQDVEASEDWEPLAYGGASGGTGGNGVVSAEESHFPLQVALGNVPGMSAINKFGRSTNVDTGIETDIWDRANPTDDQPIWVAPTQARIHNIVSSSTSDVATTGAGARTIRVFGLTSWSTKEISEDISMNGTTNVATINSYVIIHRMRVLTKGATSVNVGTITATAVTDGTVTAQINPDQGQTQMAIYGWPSIQKFCVTEVYAGILRANLGVQESQADVQFLLNPEPDVELLNFQIKHPTMVGSRAQTPFTHNFNPYGKWDGPGILKMQAIGSASNLDISGGFSFILVDN
jgi:hypothetical protein